MSWYLESMFSEAKFEPCNDAHIKAWLPNSASRLSILFFNLQRHTPVCRIIMQGVWFALFYAFHVRLMLLWDKWPMDLYTFSLSQPINLYSK